MCTCIRSWIKTDPTYIHDPWSHVCMFKLSLSLSLVHPHHHPSFPIRVRASVLSRRGNLTYSGKYCTHVLKCQLITSHTQIPLWFSGPHLGVDHDSKIWSENPQPPLDDEEELLAGTSLLCVDAPR
jgi:hypothetical protein